MKPALNSGALILIPSLWNRRKALLPIGLRRPTAAPISITRILMLLLIRSSPRRPQRPQSFFLSRRGCTSRAFSPASVPARRDCFSGLPVPGYGLPRGRRPRAPCQSLYRKSALRFGADFRAIWSRELREALMATGIKKILPKPGFSDSEKVRIFFRNPLPPL